MNTAMNADGSAEIENEKFKKSIRGRLNTMRSELESLSWNLLDDDVVKTAVSGLNTILNLVGHLTDAVGTLGIALATSLGVISKNDPTRGLFKVIDYVDKDGRIAQSSRFKYDLPGKLNTGAFKESIKGATTLNEKIKIVGNTLKETMQNHTLFDKKLGAQTIRKAYEHQESKNNLEKDVTNVRKLAEMEAQLFDLDNIPVKNRTEDFDVKRKMLTSDMENITSDTSLRALSYLEQAKTSMSDFPSASEWFEDFNKNIGSLSEKLSAEFGVNLPSYLRTLRAQTLDLANDFAQIIDYDNQLKDVSLDADQRKEIQTQREETTKRIQRKREEYLPDAGNFAKAYYEDALKENGDGATVIQTATENMNNYVQSQGKAVKSAKGLKGILSGVSAETKNMAKNIASGLAIGLVIEVGLKAIQGIDKALNISSTAKIEDMEKAVNNYDEAIKKTTDNVTSINKVKDDFYSLADGVDASGHNIGLTADEYAKYNDIVKELVAINPAIVQGYNEQHQAIVDKNKAISETIALQREEARNATKAYIGQGKEIYEGIEAQNHEDLANMRSDFEDIFNFTAEYRGTGFSKTNDPEFIKAFNDIYGAQWNGLNPRDFIDKKESILSAIGQIGKYDKSEIEQISKDIDELGISYQTALSKTVEFREYLNTLAFSDKELGGLGFNNINKELKEPLSNYIEELSVSGEDFDEIRSKLMSFGSSLSDLGQDTHYADALRDIKAAKSELDHSDWDANDINKYNTAVKLGTNALRNYANGLDASGNHIAGFTALSEDMRQAILEVADSYDYLTSNMTLSDALNIDSVGLDNARTQLEQFQKVIEQGNYSDAIRDYKTIYETILDKGDKGSIHSQGKGDQTFWDGAERILGTKKLKEINYNVGKAKTLMKEYKSSFEGGWNASNLLFNKLSKNVDGINEVLGRDALSMKGDILNIDYIDPSEYEQIADYLGMSRDMFVSLLDNARQFGDLSFVNIDKLAATLKQAAENQIDQSLLLSNNKGKETTYSSYSAFASKAAEQGITPDKVQLLSKELATDKNIILVDPDQMGTVNQFLKDFQTTNDEHFMQTDRAGMKEVLNPTQFVTALSTVLSPEEIAKVWNTKRINGTDFIMDKERGEEEYDYNGDRELTGDELSDFINSVIRENEPKTEEDPNNPVTAIENQTDAIVNRLDALILATGGNPGHGVSSNMEKATNQQAILDKMPKNKTARVSFDSEMDTLRDRLSSLKQLYEDAGKSDEFNDLLKDENSQIGQLNAKIEELEAKDVEIKFRAAVQDSGKNNILDLITNGKGEDVKEQIVDLQVEYETKGNSEAYQKMLADLEKTQGKKFKTVVQTIIEGKSDLKFVNDKIFEIQKNGTVKCIFSADDSDYKKKWKQTKNGQIVLDESDAKPKIDADDSKYKKKAKKTKKSQKELGKNKAKTKIDADDSKYKKKAKRTKKSQNKLRKNKAKTKIDANDSKYKKKARGVKNSQKKLSNNKANPKIGANKKAFDKTHKVINGKLCHLVDHEWVPVVNANVGNSEQKIQGVKGELDNLPTTKSVSIIAKFTGFVGKAWDYVYNKWRGGSSASGTPGRISPSYANGTPERIMPSYARGKKKFGSKGGLSLTGELGPELIWSGNHSYLVGERGPEMVKLKPGDVVYPADETKRILMGRRLHTKFGSNARGSLQIHKVDTTETETTTKVTKKKKHTVTTTKNTHKTTTNNKPSKKNTPKKNTPKKEKDKRLKKYEAGKNRLDHLLQMGYISEKTYYTRLQKLYNKHLKGVKKFIKERRQAQEDIHSHIIAAYENEKSILNYNLQMGFISQKTYYERLVALKDKYLKKNKGFAKERRDALLEEKDTLLAVYEKEKSDLQHKLAMNQINYATYYKNLKDLDNKYLKGKKKFTEEYKKQLEEEKNAHNDAYNAASEYVDYLYNTGRITDDERLKRQENLYKKYYPKLGKGVYKYESRQEAEKLLGIANENYSKDVSDLNEKLEKGLITIDEYFLSINKLTDKYKKYKNGMKDTIEDTAEDALNTIGSKFDEKLSDLQQLISDKDLFHAWKNDESPIIYYQNLTKEIDRAFTLGMISADKYKDLIEEINRIIKQTQDTDFNKQHGQLSSMVDLVEQLVRQEAQDQIDALNKQSEVYNKIIDQKRKSLDLTEKELSFQENMEDIATQIAEKQNEINLLSRDDSRSGKAKLSEAQKELKELLKNQEHALREETTHKINERYDESIEQHSALIERHVKSISDWLDDKAAVLDKVFEEIDNKGTNDLLARLLLYNQQHGDGFDVTVLNYWKDLQEVLKFKTGPVKDILLELKRLTDVDHIKNGIVPPPNQSVTKRHNGLSGGYIGDNVTPKMNETYALLTRDELVLNRQDQDMLAAKLKHGEAYKDLMESISKTAGISHASNVRTSQNTDIKIENNIQINSTGDLPSDIDKIGEQLSNKTLSKLQNALQINGVRPNININTYNRN